MARFETALVLRVSGEVDARTSVDALTMALDLASKRLGVKRSDFEESTIHALPYDLTEVISGTMVDFHWEDETHTWHFHAQGIMGGGQRSLREARAAAHDAVAFSEENA